MTPMLMALLAGSRVDIPTIDLLLDIVQVVIFPVVLGVSLNRYAPKVTRSILPVAPFVAVIMITIIVASIIGA